MVAALHASPRPASRGESAASVRAVVADLLPRLLVLGVGRLDATNTPVPETAAPTPPLRRVDCVDACRMIAVVGMLAANLVNVCLHDVPPVLSHNWGERLRFFDFPAPLFQFLVGLSLPLFLAARRRRGWTDGEARLGAARRFVGLVLLGVLLDGIGALSAIPRWGVLQTLGLGGLLATVLDGSPRLAWGVALALLAVFSGPANGVVHARPDAALAFVPLTLAGAWVGGRVARDPAPHLVAGDALGLAAVSLALGLALRAAGVPFSKVAGTSSFVLVAGAVSAATLAATASLEASGRRIPDVLLRTGRSALTVWVLLHVFVYYPAWNVFPAWERLPLAVGLAAAATLTVALCGATVALDRRGLRVPL